MQLIWQQIYCSFSVLPTDIGWGGHNKEICLHFKLIWWKGGAWQMFLHFLMMYGIPVCRHIRILNIFVVFYNRKLEKKNAFFFFKFSIPGAISDADLQQRIFQLQILFFKHIWCQISLNLGQVFHNMIGINQVMLVKFSEYIYMCIFFKYSLDVT